MKWFRRRRRLDEDLSEELRSHLEMRAEVNTAAGMTPEQARAAARRQFGNPTLIHEETRRVHVNEYLETVAQDLRYAVRGFLRNPAFTLTAILALALGIGATTAVFSVVDRVLFRALPYADADRLVSFGIMAPLASSEFFFSGPYLEWRRADTPFAAMTSWSGMVDCDLSDRNPARLACAHVESTFLPTFGIHPLIGRNFTTFEDTPHGAKVALLSHGLWRSRFAGDPRVLGRIIHLDGEPVTVIGVLPRDFELPRLNQADILVPQRLAPPLTAGGPGHAIRTFARLKPGIRIRQAYAGLQPLFARFMTTVPPAFRKEVTLRLRSVRDLQTQDARLASWLLLGSVAAVLLIACANVANLVLARAAQRRREMAVRAVLGAGPRRLIRQTLTESLLLAVIGGAAGCGLAWLLLRVFLSIAPAGIIHLEQARLDQRVLLFTLATACASGLLFGLAPALESPRVETLAGWRAIGATRGAFRKALVVAQVCASLVLLTGAGLLMRSLWNLENAPLGLRGTSSIIEAHFVLGLENYRQPARQMAFFERLEARLDRLPGVTAAALSDSIPPSGPMRAMPYTAIQAERHPRYTKGVGGMIGWRFITPGYFAAMGVPILRGRGFTPQDRNAAENSVVISASLARRLFPQEDPIGRHVRFSGAPWYTVAGICGDVKSQGLAEPAGPEYYLVRRRGDDPVYRNQMPPTGWRGAYAIIRTPEDPAAAADTLRRTIAALDPTVPIEVRTMRERVGRLAERPRFDATLLGLFAAMGVLLAAIGLYGVIAFLVAQRTQEIGVRMALGATPPDIVKLMLSHVARWTLLGTLLGIAGSLASAHWLRAMLFGVTAYDPVAIASAVVLLLSVAMLAAWLPSRRAARVDPMRALRIE
jgi:putative ABC transport system permease protein